uniref:Uncharacterized protein n=1 Tax=Chromera velia CCMP2878 TaxID=1169474 RepID=A0A0G4FQZ9_9ALVE|eukprot:Cvel_18300.t1-p1 / transcript=Cvel_18300.t1 / gene=Cvel_18300 / organism=Chromera_velia_CCMP2878 / gene_product=hypothetical protein / transcript_product=hypothetical protein / location=Cvel_scaffold1509:3079-10863(+) / protein_length=520 / sequence_SO=supercontig / SO=protein_coding / is_pseudo=false
MKIIFISIVALQLYSVSAASTPVTLDTSHIAEPRCAEALRELKFPLPQTEGSGEVYCQLLDFLKSLGPGEAPTNYITHSLPFFIKVNVLEEVKNFLLDVMRGETDEPVDFNDFAINATLTGIGIGPGTFQDPFVFNKWKHFLTPSAILAPYDLGGGKTRLEHFIDKVFDLISNNPIFVATLYRVHEKYPISTWAERMERSLRNEDGLLMTSLKKVITASVHQAAVYDGLVREMYRDPAGFLHDLEKSLQVNFEVADMSGTSLFYNVKYPSVRKPIKEFVRASRETRQKKAIEGGKAVAQQLQLWDVEDAELEAAQAKRKARRKNAKNKGKVLPSFLWPRRDFKQRTEINLASMMVERDPTKALRTNILEATYAELYLWRGYYGKTKGCDESCYEKFGEGKYLFTDSRSWAYLYHAWNAAFCLTTGSIGKFWAKLFVPAVMEDDSGESYIIRRTLALWLALTRIANRIAMRNNALLPTVDDHEFDNDDAMQILRHFGGVSTASWAAEALMAKAKTGEDILV